MKRRPRVVVISKSAPPEDPWPESDFDLIWCTSWQGVPSALGNRGDQRFVVVDASTGLDALDIVARLRDEVDPVHAVISTDEPRRLRAELKRRGLFAEVLRGPVRLSEVLPRMGLRIRRRRTATFDLR
jgi:hypothetical protein